MPADCLKCKPWDDGECDFGCPCDDCGGPDRFGKPEGSYPGECANCLAYLPQKGGHVETVGFTTRFTCAMRVCVCAVGFVSPVCFHGGDDAIR